MKHHLVTVLLLLLAVYATWQKLQAMAIFSALAMLAVIYRRHARRVFDVALVLFSSTKQAKLGNLELTIEKRIADLSQKIQQATWVNIVLSQLSSEEVGLLLAISRADNFVPIDAIKDQLRKLRAKGLIHHDKPSMSESKRVWLTEFGSELTKLLDSPLDVERPEAESSSEIDGAEPAPNPRPQADV